MVCYDVNVAITSRIVNVIMTCHNHSFMCAGIRIIYSSHLNHTVGILCSYVFHNKHIFGGVRFIVTDSLTIYKVKQTTHLRVNNHNVQH